MLMKIKEYLQTTPISPHWTANHCLEKSISTLLMSISSETVIDVGCGTKPYKKYIAHKYYFGIEIPGGSHPEDKKDCDVFYNGNEFPFKENSIDLIVITQVLEHVEKPWDIIFKLSKLLKKDGYILISVPFVSNLHEIPYDYFRFTPYSLIKMMNNNALKAVTIKKSCGLFGTIGFLISDLFYSSCIEVHSKLKIFCAVLFCAPVQIFFMMLDIIFLKKGINLDWIILAKKK